MVRKSLRFLACVTLLMGLAVLAGAQETGQRTFSSPHEASKALYDALKADDSSAALAVLGSSADAVLHSGDEVQDKKNLQLFLDRYEQMNRIGKQADGQRIMYLGADNWPFPIPIVEKAGKWYFDTAAGKSEILFRRIGKNELAAIRVLHALVNAQNEYYQGTHDGATHQYAGRILSTAGKQDGLYWKTAEGEPESPIGPIVAYATKEGYTTKGEPFHGYFFRLLDSQGAGAPGGAKPYSVDGKMTGGFAFIAWPAEYRNSGVMTFMVGMNGAVLEKDLGKDTSTTAPSTKSFNPDKTWNVIPGDEGEQDESADQ